MKVARNVAEVLSEHVTLEVECIDRLYLNLYVPILQREAGVGHSWIRHRGHRFASSSLMAPMTRAFVGAIEHFAEQERIPLIPSSHRYRVTDFGFRSALFLVRSYVRLLRPGLAVIGPRELPLLSPLRKAFSRVDAAIDRAWSTAA